MLLSATQPLFGVITTVGRLVILVLIIVTVIVLWKAFGPGSRTGTSTRGRMGSGEWKNLGRKKQQELPTKGPDDDPDFLWNIEKERFKQRREAERKAEREAEELRLRRKMEQKYGKNADNRADKKADHTDTPEPPRTKDDPQSTRDDDPQAS